VPVPVDRQSAREIPTGALELPYIPASLAPVGGGGYIGLELGSVYAGSAARSHRRRDDGRLLPGSDRDLVRHSSRSGIEFRSARRCG